MPTATASIDNLAVIADDILRYIDINKRRVDEEKIIEFPDDYFAFDDHALLVETETWGTRDRKIFSYYTSNEKMHPVFKLTVDPWFFQFKARAEYGMMHYSPEITDTLGNVWHERLVNHAGGWNPINSIRFDLKEMKKH